MYIWTFHRNQDETIILAGHGYSPEEARALIMRDLKLPTFNREKWDACAEYIKTDNYDLVPPDNTWIITLDHNFYR